MEVVLLILMGIFWFIVQIVKWIGWSFEASKQHEYDLVANDVLATNGEAFIARKYVWSENEIDKISKELDEIFGDSWHQWSDADKTLNTSIWTEGTYKTPYSVIYHLLLAKEGKINRNGPAKYVKPHAMCGLSEEESFEVLKKISLVIERLLIEKHPKHAYDLEMLTNGTSIMQRYWVKYIDASGSWKRLEM